MKIYNYLVSKKSNYLLIILFLVLIILGIFSKLSIKTEKNEIPAPDSLNINIEIIEEFNDIAVNNTTKQKIVNYSKKLNYDKITNLTEYIDNNAYRSERFNDDIVQLKQSLENLPLKTNKFLIVATINKETKFQNIRSYSESDVFGFVQMKVSTIHFLKRIYPELPLIQNGNEFINNVEAQVLYCDSYYHYISEKFNLTFEKRNDIILLARMYNGGERGYVNSKPSYYNTILKDYISLKEI